MPMTEASPPDTTSDYGYDVFISYASEERAWVDEHVFRPLCQCRCADGRPPRIFFDISREGGIRSGQDFVVALTKALHSSRHIVPVFSDLYLRKDMCQWELKQAWNMDPAATRNLLNPILTESSASPPEWLELVHFVGPVITTDWFERLCEGLELIPGSEQVALTFLTQPRDVHVNHTIEPILVAFARASDGGVADVDQDVLIRGEGCVLQGTLRVAPCDGVATFSDLSCSDPCAGARVVVAADGLDPLMSDEFAVHEPIATTAFREEQAALSTPLICAHGEPVFFENGLAVAIVGKDVVGVYDRGGQSLCTAPGLEILGSIRSWTRFDDHVVMLDWLGNVYLLTSDGRSARWSLNEEGAGFVIPGGAAQAHGTILVGFWSGHVFAVSIGAAPVTQFIHPQGVQAIAAFEDRVFVCDFEGKLTAYRDRRRTNTVALERGLHLLKACSRNLLAVGDDKLYHITPSPLVVLDEKLPMGRIASCLGDTDYPVIVDADGKGYRLSGALSIVGGFHTIAGATPTSADDAGRYCILVNPDATRTVLALQDAAMGRIVHTHSAGALAVAPDGDLFAVEDADGVHLVPTDSIAALFSGGAENA